MRKRLTYLLLGSLGLWAVLCYPAYTQMGEQAVIHGTTALVLCLIPTSFTLVWASRRPKPTPTEQLMLVFGGTGLRMGFVLGVGLLLYVCLPYFQQTSFWLWVLVFYLYTLALETILVQGTRPSTQKL